MYFSSAIIGPMCDENRRERKRRSEEEKKNGVKGYDSGC